jgi:AraC-like DNA-binding protein
MSDKFCRFERILQDHETGETKSTERHILHKKEYTFMRLSNVGGTEWIQETKPEDLKVLLLLGNFVAHGTNVVHYSSITRGELAKDCKLSPRTLRSRIKDLEDSNRLQRVGAGVIYVNPLCLSTLPTTKMSETIREYEKIRSEFYGKSSDTKKLSQ